MNPIIFIQLDTAVTHRLKSEINCTLSCNILCKFDKILRFNYLSAREVDKIENFDYHLLDRPDNQMYKNDSSNFSQGWQKISCNMKINKTSNFIAIGWPNNSIPIKSKKNLKLHLWINFNMANFSLKQE
jgi:hypothetical protein